MCVCVCVVGGGGGISVGLDNNCHISVSSIPQHEKNKTWIVFVVFVFLLKGGHSDWIKSPETK